MNCTGHLVVDTMGTGVVKNITLVGQGSTTLALVDVFPNGSGPVALSLPPGVCNTSDGQPSLPTPLATVIYDDTPPTVTVTSLGGYVTANTNTLFAIQFSEPVLGFFPSSIILSNNSHIVAFFSFADRPGYYEVLVATTGNDIFTVEVAHGAARDRAGRITPLSNQEVVLHYVPKKFAKPVCHALSAIIGSIIAKSLATTVLANYALATSAAALGSGMSTVGTATSGLMLFIGHLQFLQMMNMADVPMDGEVREVTYCLNWLNNGFNSPFAKPLPTLSLNTTSYTNRTLGDPVVVQPRANRGRSLLQAETSYGLYGNRSGVMMQVLGGLTAADLQWIQSLSMKPPTTQASAPRRSDVTDLTSEGDFFGVLFYVAIELAVVTGVHLLVLALWWLGRKRKRYGMPLLPKMLLFPRPELMICMLTFPGMARACAYYISSGAGKGVPIGTIVLLAFPFAFIALCFYVVLRVILGKRRAIFVEQSVRRRRYWGHTTRQLAPEATTESGATASAPWDEDADHESSHAHDRAPAGGERSQGHPDGSTWLRNWVELASKHAGVESAGGTVELVQPLAVTKTGSTAAEHLDVDDADDDEGGAGAGGRSTSGSQRGMGKSVPGDGGSRRPTLNVDEMHVVPLSGPCSPVPEDAEVVALKGAGRSKPADQGWVVLREGRWKDVAFAPGRRDYATQFGLLFEDLRGPLHPRTLFGFDVLHAHVHTGPGVDDRQQATPGPSAPPSGEVRRLSSSRSPPDRRPSTEWLKTGDSAGGSYLASSQLERPQTPESPCPGCARNSRENVRDLQHHHHHHRHGGRGGHHQAELWPAQSGAVPPMSPLASPSTPQAWDVTRVEDNHKLVGAGTTSRSYLSVFTPPWRTDMGNVGDDVEEHAAGPVQGGAIAYLRSSYMLLVIMKQLLFALVMGLDSINTGQKVGIGWLQMVSFTIWLVLHATFLVVVKPFVARLSTLLEAVTIVCELGVIACGLALLSGGVGASSTGFRHSASTAMLVLMAMAIGIQFVAQMYDLATALAEMIAQHRESRHMKASTKRPSEFRFLESDAVAAMLPAHSTESPSPELPPEDDRQSRDSPSLISPQGVSYLPCDSNLLSKYKAPSRKVLEGGEDKAEAAAVGPNVQILRITPPGGDDDQEAAFIRNLGLGQERSASPSTYEALQRAPPLWLENNPMPEPMLVLPYENRSATPMQEIPSHYVEEPRDAQGEIMPGGHISPPCYVGSPRGSQVNGSFGAREHRNSLADGKWADSSAEMIRTISNAGGASKATSPRARRDSLVARLAHSLSVGAAQEPEINFTSVLPNS
eukprot:jgi/Mesvir1/19346/Mv10401-RA.2